MTLATETDVQARLGRVLTAAEAERVPGLLVEAEALVTAFVGRPVTPSDEVVPIVESRMAARALQSATSAGVTQAQQSAGAFSVGMSYSVDAQGGGVWLSSQDKMLLKSLGRAASMQSIGLVSERTE